MHILRVFLFVFVLCILNKNGASIGETQSTTTNCKCECEYPRQTTQKNLPHLPLRSKCDPRSRYYTYNGSCNNLYNPSWGQAETYYERYIKSNNSNHNCSIKTSWFGPPLPLAREIETSLLANHTVSFEKYDYNILYYVFGQWVHDDISSSVVVDNKTSCCSNFQPDICLPIFIPKNDPFYSQLDNPITCIDMKRVKNSYNLKFDQNEFCVPINFETTWLDLSTLYGSSAKLVKKLRTGFAGKLKYSGIFMSDYQLSEFTEKRPIDYNCFLPDEKNEVGDRRWRGDSLKVNENPALMMILTLFHKLHNLIATAYRNFKSNDEEIFQESRRHLIAAYQNIIFSEYLPATIGPTNCIYNYLLPLSEGHISYDPQIKPHVLLEYSFAAGRASHSLITGIIKYTNSSAEGKKLKEIHEEKCILERETFHRLLKMYGHIKSNEQNRGNKKVGSFLPNVEKEQKKDLETINILRGRDAILPSYTTVRRYLTRERFHTFEDLEGIMSKELIMKLKSIYTSVNDIDLYVGGILEKPVRDSRMGITFTTLFSEVFYKLKFGDRLHYESREAGFSEDELTEIRKIKFSYLLCLINPVKEAPLHSFLMPSENNRKYNCSDILEKGPNLTLWTQVKMNVIKTAIKKQ